MSKLLEPSLARNSDYKEFKKILDRGKHPAFIGRGTMMRNAENGGALFWMIEQRKIGVSLINPHYGILIGLNVLPEMRGRGIGDQIIRFLVPNFVRAISEKVPYFEKLGYIKVGDPHQGVKLKTQVMVRGALFNLAGNLKKAWA